MKEKLKNKKLILAISLIMLLLVIAVFYFGFSYYVASEMVKANREKVDSPPQIIAEEYEDIIVKKTDNGVLKGWLFKGSNSKLIIFVEGFYQNRLDTEHYRVLVARDFIANGYNVLMYDNQATGESTGDYVSFGIKESKDLVLMVNFAKNNGFEAKNIGIIGHSMGAISELLVADQLKEVGAIVADSPAEDIKATMANILQNEKGLPGVFMFGVFTILKVAYAVDVDNIKPLDHVKQVPLRTILYLHGGKDTSIYPWNSQRLLAVSNPKSKLVIFPLGKHVETYKTDPALYRKEVFGYLKEQLGE